MIPTRTLFVLDILLLSFFFFFMKRKSPPAASRSDAAGRIRDEDKRLVNSALENESGLFKYSLAGVDRKIARLKRIESSLTEKDKKIDSRTNMIEARFINSGISHEERPRGDDAYRLALTMLRNGSSVNVVAERLGLLNGEVELIKSINDYKVS